jgi:hypothetical protein
MPTYLRGFLPSLGAGGSLVGASLVVAAILSSVIAFQGWPGMAGNGGGNGSVTLKDSRSAPPGPAPALSRPAAGQATRTTGAAARPVARRRGAARGTAGPTARRRGSTPVAPRTTSPAPSAPGSSPSTGSAPSSSAPPARPSAPRPTKPSSPPPSSPPSSPIPANPLPDHPVSSVVDTVQKALPPTPPVVQPVVDTVNQVADDAAGTVDGVVGGVLGGLGG